MYFKIVLSKWQVKEGICPNKLILTLLGSSIILLSSHRFLSTLRFPLWVQSLVLEIRTWHRIQASRQGHGWGCFLQQDMGVGRHLQRGHWVGEYCDWRFQYNARLWEGWLLRGKTWSSCVSNASMFTCRFIILRMWLRNFTKIWTKSTNL